MVKIVNIAAFSIFGINPVYRAVCVVESTRETAEQLCHGKIRLEMSDVNGRVNQPGFSVISREIIAVP